MASAQGADAGLAGEVVLLGLGAAVNAYGGNDLAQLDQWDGALFDEQAGRNKFDIIRGLLVSFELVSTQPVDQ